MWIEMYRLNNVSLVIAESPLMQESCLSITLAQWSNLSLAREIMWPPECIKSPKKRTKAALKNIEPFIEANDLFIMSDDG